MVKISGNGFTFLIFLFLLLAVPGSINATTLIDMSINELSDEANWVARVKVTQITTSNASDFPYREIQGQILEVFKGAGEVDEYMSLRLPGGEVEGTTYEVMGLPEFREGGEYIVFLNADPRHIETAMVIDGASQLTGWSAFKVLRQNDEPKWVMRADNMSLVKSTQTGYTALQKESSVKDYQAFVTSIFESFD